MDSDIKIFISCHKPSILPHCDLFIPIHVGAAISDKVMNMIRDDTGDNISVKNRNYCELTAQYWAWKNADADYYGFFHYRRFFCFKMPSGMIKRNERNHVVCQYLTEKSLRKFGLDSAETMSSIIERNDVIAPEFEDVRNIETQHGKQQNVYNHWLAYEDILIKKKDLDLMLVIMKQVSPILWEHTIEYFKGYRFVGYNCFIMKKRFFDELCRIEFSVLCELEKQLDIHDYSPQLSRVFGYMGEIISSSYIYYLEKSNKAKVERLPILFYNNTEDIGAIQMAFGSAKRVCNKITGKVKHIIKTRVHI